ncbi:hypothetical protein AB0C96_35835 [Streptomyces sp. NPDC048506]
MKPLSVINARRGPLNQQQPDGLRTAIRILAVMNNALGAHHDVHR